MQSGFITLMVFTLVIFFEGGTYSIWIEYLLFSFAWKTGSISNLPLIFLCPFSYLPVNLPPHPTIFVNNLPQTCF